MPLAYMNAYPPTISCSATSLTGRSLCRDGGRHVHHSDT
jgi:hypothetical protein